MADQVSIEHRFRGFVDNALGGYVGGLLANRLDASAEVLIRGPVPLDEELTIGVPGPGRATLENGEALCAEARVAELELELPEIVSVAAAKDASPGYPGHEAHPFPGCFTCGPGRQPGDGLRIFPGPVAGSEIVAAPWTPEPSLADADGAVRPEFVWAALDCPQLWALMTSAPRDSEERAVTAAMTARIDAPPEAGAPHAVMAWPIRREGRALFAGGAVVSGQGDVVAAGIQRAVVVPDRGVPLGLDNLSAPDAT